MPLQFTSMRSTNITFSCKQCNNKVTVATEIHPNTYYNRTLTCGTAIAVMGTAYNAYGGATPDVEIG